MIRMIPAAIRDGILFVKLIYDELMRIYANKLNLQSGFKGVNIK